MFHSLAFHSISLRATPFHPLPKYFNNIITLQNDQDMNVFHSDANSIKINKYSMKTIIGSFWYLKCMTHISKTDGPNFLFNPLQVIPTPSVNFYFLPVFLGLKAYGLHKSGDGELVILSRISLFNLQLVQVRMIGSYIL